MKRIQKWIAALLVILFLLPCLPAFPADAATGSAMAHFRELIGTETILSALYEADIASLRKAIDMGLVTCEELTAYYLERIEAYNEEFNCFITMCDDPIGKARQCDEAIANGTARGKLFGIPIVVKDNFHYNGYYMTNGLPFEQSEISYITADVLRYALSEGAIVLAKTNMSTKAETSIITESQTIGLTNNAYNPQFASGGSSGGSAVATSLNFAAAGFGTDTNASLRYPAALNGCVALRVTHGALSLEGIKKLNRTRDVPGVITRTVYDQALILDVMSGGKTDYAANLDINALDGLRIGVYKELSYPNSWLYLMTEERIDDEVAAAFDRCIEELKACGAEIVVVSAPDVFTLTNITLEENSAESKRTLYNYLRTAMEDAGVSALIFPTYVNTPIRCGRDDNGKYWDPFSQDLISNCTYVSPSSTMPEITVPIGVHSLGSGIGLEIAALKNQEQLLLDIAYAYTSRYDHRVPPNTAPNLHEGTLSLQEIFDAYDEYTRCIGIVPEVTEYADSLEQISRITQMYQWGLEAIPEALDIGISLDLPT